MHFANSASLPLPRIDFSMVGGNSSNAGSQQHRCFTNLVLHWLYRADLRRGHRLCHVEEHGHALAAAPRRERFVGGAEAAVDVVPVVHYQNVTRGADRQIGLHLQTTTDSFPPNSETPP